MMGIMLVYVEKKERLYHEWIRLSRGLRLHQQLPSNSRLFYPSSHFALHLQYVNRRTRLLARTWATYLSYTISIYVQNPNTAVGLSSALNASHQRFLMSRPDHSLSHSQCFVVLLHWQRNTIRALKSRKCKLIVLCPDASINKKVNQFLCSPGPCRRLIQRMYSQDKENPRRVKKNDKTTTRS